MSARYKVQGPFVDDAGSLFVNADITVQCADLVDTRNGHVYRAGAYRVLVHGKPIRGKGGTVPFKGETAWSDADRKASDLYWEVRNAR